MDKRGRIPKGCGLNPRSLRYASSTYRKGTTSSAGLALEGLISATRLRIMYKTSSSSREIRQKFLEFMKEKGHAVVPSSSLVPDDPSVLLTTAVREQFKR